MSLILALGANIGEPINQLHHATEILSQHFQLISKSRIYTSKAQDYLNQPDFFNQVLEFHLPHETPKQVLMQIQEIELSLGRMRDIPRGPRFIDIDILFYSLEQINTNDLQIPHPRLWTRSFVVRPLKELPYFDILKHHFEFPDHFDEDAFVLAEQKD